MRNTAAVTLLAAALALASPARGQDYDLVIRNGRVVDGTGAPWRRADVAVRGDTIVAVAPGITARGATDDRRGRPRRGPGLHRHPHPRAARDLRGADGRELRPAGRDDAGRGPGRLVAAAARRLPREGGRPAAGGQLREPGRARLGARGGDGPSGPRAVGGGARPDAGPRPRGDAGGRVRSQHRALLRPRDVRPDGRGGRPGPGGGGDGRDPRLAHAGRGGGRRGERARDDRDRRGGAAPDPGHAPQDDRPRGLGPECRDPAPRGGGPPPRRRRHDRPVSLHGLEHRAVRGPLPGLGARGRDGGGEEADRESGRARPHPRDRGGEDPERAGRRGRGQHRDRGLRLRPVARGQEPRPDRDRPRAPSHGRERGRPRDRDRREGRGLGDLPRDLRRGRRADPRVALHDGGLGRRDPGVREGRAAPAQLRHLRPGPRRLRAREEAADPRGGGAEDDVLPRGPPGPRGPRPRAARDEGRPRRPRPRDGPRSGDLRRAAPVRGGGQPGGGERPGGAGRGGNDRGRAPAASCPVRRSRARRADAAPAVAYWRACRPPAWRSRSTGRWPTSSSIGPRRATPSTRRWCASCTTRSGRPPCATTSASSSSRAAVPSSAPAPTSSG